MLPEEQDIRKDIHTHFYRLVEDFKAGGKNLRDINEADYEAIEFTKGLGQYAADQRVFGQVLKMISAYYILSSFFLVADHANHEMVKVLKEVPTEETEAYIANARNVLKMGEDAVLKSNSFGIVKRYAESNGLEDPSPLIDFTTPRLVAAND